ncbi:hypothetical protein A6770_21870 [Nostoc minutum NIES-26]|uniref:Uncharacterized protein n=1 Tax=Nostoc minutum NIES-26 TaxID=1844469 RepID=A0A367QZM1_9NOSO|nr:hypothetical protein A6770_21870 [Nostoc minutum NIES-26]
MGSHSVAVSSPLGGFADLKELRTRRGVTPVKGSGVETPKTALLHQLKIRCNTLINRDGLM